MPQKFKSIFHQVRACAEPPRGFVIRYLPQRQYHPLRIIVAAAYEIALRRNILRY